MIFLNIYATIISLLGVFFYFTNDFSGSPRSGRILTALVLFFIVCIFAEKIVSQQYADVFLRLFCCLSLSFVTFVLV